MLVPILVLSIGLSLLCVLSSTKHYFEHDPHVEELMELLFLNRTASNYEEGHLRRLQISKPPYDPKIKYPCTTCDTLKYCSIVNKNLIQERYYPQKPSRKESCRVLDDLGRRMSENVFGVGKTFRDSPTCRNFVLQYLCLTWSSHNDQYQNFCAYPEQEFMDIDRKFRIAPKPPCKSFCVQVAQVCANDPKFILTCNSILCPPLVEEDCNPDPYMIDSSGELNPLAANLGCDVPYFADPYAPKSGAARKFDTSVTLVVTLFVAVSFSTTVMWM